VASNPKTRTIRAWAVACGFGRMHGDTVYPSRPSATMERNYLNLKAMVLCGPHTVIPLSGVWPRKARAKARRR
jgi:hypothetical protein